MFHNKQFYERYVFTFFSAYAFGMGLAQNLVRAGTGAGVSCDRWQIVRLKEIFMNIWPRKLKLLLVGFVNSIN